MMRALAILIFLVAWPLQAATTWFVADTQSGNHLGGDTNNCIGLSAYNTAAGAGGAGIGPILAGDTVCFVGTLTQPVGHSWSGVTIIWTNCPTSIGIVSDHGSGTGSPVNSVVNVGGFYLYSGTHDVKWRCRLPAGRLVVEMTNNGTLFGTQVLAKMLWADTCSNLDIAGICFSNGYVHRNWEDILSLNDQEGGVFSSQAQGTWTIQDCGCYEMSWCVCLNSGSLSGTNILNLWSNDFHNFDHGLAFAPGTNAYWKLSVISNYFGSTQVWDNTNNWYHHDGVHIFGVPNQLIQYDIADNVFGEDWGTNNTGHIFLEKVGWTPVVHGWIHDNRFACYPGRTMNNGFLNFLPNGGWFFNNTLLGNGSPSYAIRTTGTNMLVVNNLFRDVATFSSDAPFAGYTNTFIAFSNNIYAGLVSSGNSPWYLNDTPYYSLVVWQGAVGDQNSQYFTTAPASLCDTNTGLLTTNSAAIGAGANLSSLGITVDGAFNARPPSSAWDIGAFQFSSGGGNGGGPSQGPTSISGAAMFNGVIQ